MDDSSLFSSVSSHDKDNTGFRGFSNLLLIFDNFFCYKYFFFSVSSLEKDDGPKVYRGFQTGFQVGFPNFR